MIWLFNAIFKNPAQAPLFVFLQLVGLLSLITVFGWNPTFAFDAPASVLIPAGPFKSGSSAAERDYAYTLDEKAYGHANTRKFGWYDREGDPLVSKTNAYRIMIHPVTQAQYHVFVTQTGHRVPDVGQAEWTDYKLIHPFKRTAAYAWRTGSYPKEKANHPVTMVAYKDAKAYAKWLSTKTGNTWRLPTGAEWEKAMRGVDGNIFPWGNKWDAKKSASHDNGPFGTVPVGSIAGNISPFGVGDAAGQVFEWTSQSKIRLTHYVRGGSWDDRGCGVCRPSAKHSRPDHIKHILIGFRLVSEVP